MSETKPTLVVFLHSHRYDRLYQAVSIVLSASSMGWACHLFLFYDALASYLDGSWDEVNITDYAAEDPLQSHPRWLTQMGRGFEAGNFPSLYEMLKKATRESGGTKILACSTSCKVLDLDLATVRTRVDEVVGLTTMLQVTESANHVIYI
jgi:peroxiredoxin family protein